MLRHLSLSASRGPPGLQTPELQLSTTELYESQPLVATCSAPQEKGSLVFQFFQESSSVVTLLKQVFSPGNLLETKLLLGDIGDKDIFCNYSILTLPQAGSSSSSNKLKVLVKGTHAATKMSHCRITSLLPCICFNGSWVRRA